jgi:hypothetical protein
MQAYVPQGAKFDLHRPHRLFHHPGRRKRLLSPPWAFTNDDRSSRSTLHCRTRAAVSIIVSPPSAACVSDREHSVGCALPPAALPHRPAAVNMQHLSRIAHIAALRRSLDVLRRRRRLGGDAGRRQAHANGGGLLRPSARWARRHRRSSRRIRYPPKPATWYLCD